MKTFMAVRQKPDGRIFREFIEASSYELAEAFCDLRGWQLDGRFDGSVPCTDSPSRTDNESADKIARAMAEAELDMQQ